MFDHNPFCVIRRHVREKFSESVPAAKALLEAYLLILHNTILTQNIFLRSTRTLGTPDGTAISFRQQPLLIHAPEHTQTGMQRCSNTLLK